MTSRLTALAVVAIVCCMAQHAAAGSIYGCANNRTGRIRSIALASPKCGTSETLISWNQIGPRGPGFVVKDANGVEVGVASPPSSVVMTLGGTPVFVSLTSSGFRGEVGLDQAQFYYVSSDCTGQPLLFASPDDSLFPAPALIVRGILYYGAGSVMACGNALKTYSSDPTFPSWCAQHQGTLLSDGECCRPIGPCCPGTTAPPTCASSNGIVPPWLGLGSFDLTTFTPPFHVEAQ
jgi:hypothetical protein